MIILMGGDKGQVPKWNEPLTRDCSGPRSLTPLFHAAAPVVASSA